MGYVTNFFFKEKTIMVKDTYGGFLLLEQSKLRDTYFLAKNKLVFLARETTRTLALF